MKNRYNSRSDILDECLRSIQEGKATLEDCLRAHPDAGPELRNLLETAVNTWNLMAPFGPSPEYVKTSEARLRRRMQAVQKTSNAQGANRSQSVSWGILRAAIVVLVMAVLLGSGWGVFSASAQAIPGDALYPAKLEFEQVRLALSWTAAGDVSLLAQYSDLRLEEIQLLVNKNRDRDLLEGIKQYEGTLDLLDVALQSLPQTSDLNQLQAIQVRLSVHLSILENLRSLVPSSAQEALDRVIDRSRQSQGLIQNLRLGKGPVSTPPGQQKKDTKQISPTEREQKEKTKTPPGQQKKETEKPLKKTD
ncbi:MAG: DUF5667 domain-containing protein [Anaerolineales bacterium]